MTRRIHPAALAACRAAACLLLALAAAPAVRAAGAGERVVIPHEFPPGSTAPPFSDAVVVGDAAYLAGHIGIDPRTGNAAADPQAEARLVMDAVRHTLERAGFALDDLVSVTVYCTDLGLYETFNAVYRGYFKGPHPARAFIGVDKLVRNARFEVSGEARRHAPAEAAR